MNDCGIFFFGFFLLFYFKFHDRLWVVFLADQYTLFLLLFHSKDHRRGKGLIKYDYGREKEREGEVGDVERRGRSA